MSPGAPEGAVFMFSDPAIRSFLVEPVFYLGLSKSLLPVFLQVSKNEHRYECPEL